MGIFRAVRLAAQNQFTAININFITKKMNDIVRYTFKLGENSCKRIYGIIIILILLVGSACSSRHESKSFIDISPLILTEASNANVQDGRGRFREIYCAIREHHGKSLPNDRPCNRVLHELRDEPQPTGEPVHLGDSYLNLRVIVVPGIFSECIADFISTFSDALEHLHSHGYRTDIIQVGGRSSSAFNALQIRNALMNLDASSEEKIILIGYSKGTPDILEALLLYPEIQQRISAVVSIAGVVNGSPIADRFAETYRKLLAELPLTFCPSGDGGAVDSLTRSERLQWLSKHTLPATIHYFSLAAFDERNGISKILQAGYDELSEIDPRNDSQVIFYDAILPGSTLLGYVKEDHWAIAMPFSRDIPSLASLIDKNAFPREVLLEAVVRFVEESLTVK